MQIAFIKSGNETYRFSTPESNVPFSKIIIDPAPVRLWGTYYGKGGHDLVGIANDNIGNVYFCGGTVDQTNIATSGSYQSTMIGFSDAFIAKLNPNGDRVWGTYYGGNKMESAFAMNQFNNELIVGGITSSTDNIATAGAFKDYLTPGGFAKTDVFIAKFNLDGQRIWGTYYGGEHDDTLLNMDVDPQGNIAVVGYTYSVNGIATPGAFKENREQPVEYHITGEGFIAKFTNSGFQSWGTYYYLSEVRGVGFDSASNIYFSGDVGWNDDNFTTPGTHQPVYSNVIFTGGTYDSFLIKFDPNGQRLWGTYYGDGSEYNHYLKVDHDDNVYICGSTRSSTLIATPGSHQPQLNQNMQNPSDAYLAKFNPTGQLIWGTYYGGDEQENLSRYTIDIDENNNVFFAGQTYSPNAISTNPPTDYSLTSCCSFIVKFDALGTRQWGTYFGGNIEDYLIKLKYDKNGIFYVFGTGESTLHIATPGAYQQSPSGNTDNYYINKFKDCMSATTAGSNSPVCPGNNLLLTANGGNNYAWTGPNGFSSTQQNPTINNPTTLNSGQYSCIITGGDCNNTAYVDVQVGDAIGQVPDVATLPDLTGSCNVTATAIPTATDYCSGATTAVTNDPTSFNLPGTYTIHWKYSDTNGNATFQNQTVVVTPNNDPVNTNTDYVLCDGNGDGKEFFDLTSKQTEIVNSPDYTFTFYRTHSEAQLQQNPITNNTNFENQTNPQIIYVRVYNTINTCTSLSEMTLKVNAKPVLNNATLVKCDNNLNGIQTFNLADANSAVSGNLNQTGLFYRYFNSLSDYHNGIQISNHNTFQNSSNNQIIYIEVTQSDTCSNIAAVTLTVNSITQQVLNDFDACDDNNDEVVTFDLSEKNPEMLAALPTGTYNFTYYKTLPDAIQGNANTVAQMYQNSQNPETIYISAQGASGCPVIFTLQLNVLEKPVLAMKDNWAVCKGANTLITADAGFNSYLWSTGQTSQSILVNSGGNYSVTVTKNYTHISCSTTKNITVTASDVAVINNIEPGDSNQTMRIP
ncbi:hypothetical protein [Flavobacterium sp. 3HN19-14]|uniref:hypothetical protein n=1 Tax=Flavobacterium sp. 3HN19-14 TaxID=3448133 RepID=UPI003EE4073A